MSDGVLRIFGQRNVTASGLPWIPSGIQRRISLSSLTSTILCKRHNEALSSLDEVATAFFRFLRAPGPEDAVQVFLTRGYDLERWFLKVLCGLVVSGNATFNGQRLKNWLPPAEWLQVLFGAADVQAPAGLHCIVGKYEVRETSVRVHPVFKSAAGHPIALALTFDYIAFLFAMEALPLMQRSSKLQADARYRPMALQLAWSNRMREAHLGWPDGVLVRFNISDDLGNRQ